MPESLYQRLLESSKKGERSVSAEIRFFLSRALEKPAKEKND